jgi:hypothetical protein
MKTKTSAGLFSGLPSDITDATRSRIGQKISSQLDLMNDPRFKIDNYRMIEEQGVRSYTLSASNEEMFVYFTIEWKGGMR